MDSALRLPANQSPPCSSQPLHPELPISPDQHRQLQRDIDRVVSTDWHFGLPDLNDYHHMGATLFHLQSLLHHQQNHGPQPPLPDTQHQAQGLLLSTCFDHMHVAFPASRAPEAFGAFLGFPHMPGANLNVGGPSSDRTPIDLPAICPLLGIAPGCTPCATGLVLFKATARRCAACSRVYRSGRCCTKEGHPYRRVRVYYLGYAQPPPGSKAWRTARLPSHEAQDCYYSHDEGLALVVVGPVEDGGPQAASSRVQKRRRRLPAQGDASGGRKRAGSGGRAPLSWPPSDALPSAAHQHAHSASELSGGPASGAANQAAVADPAATPTHVLLWAAPTTIAWPPELDPPPFQSSPVWPLNPPDLLQQASPSAPPPSSSRRTPAELAQHPPGHPVLPQLPATPAGLPSPLDFGPLPALPALLSAASPASPLDLGPLPSPPALPALRCHRSASPTHPPGRCRPPHLSSLPAGPPDLGPTPASCTLPLDGHQALRNPQAVDDSRTAVCRFLSGLEDFFTGPPPPCHTPTCSDIAQDWCTTPPGEAGPPEASHFPAVTPATPASPTSHPPAPPFSPAFRPLFSDAEAPLSPLSPPTFMPPTPPPCASPPSPYSFAPSTSSPTSTDTSAWNNSWQGSSWELVDADLIT